jgi:hypothetical protein
VHALCLELTSAASVTTVLSLVLLAMLVLLIIVLPGSFFGVAFADKRPKLKETPDGGAISSDVELFEAAKTEAESQSAQLCADRQSTAKERVERIVTGIC